MKIALVTGSRAWHNASVIHSTLEGFAPDLVMHGDCPTGADRIADEWATSHGVPVLRFPAEHSRSRWPAAGPVRNGDMVKAGALLSQYGNDVRAFAFPLEAARGTRDCITKARCAGLDVVVVLS